MCSNNIYFEYQDLDILGKIVVKVMHITSSLLNSFSDTFDNSYVWWDEIQHLIKDTLQISKKTKGKNGYWNHTLTLKEKNVVIIERK